MSDMMTQIKFTIDSGVVSAFKARCSREGVSMTSEVRRFMKTNRPVKDIKTRTDTRPERKKAVIEITSLLNSVLEAEAEYRDNIPERFAGRYETAEHACDQLSEAIACLEDAY